MSVSRLIATCEERPRHPNVLVLHAQCPVGVCLCGVCPLACPAAIADERGVPVGGVDVGLLGWVRTASHILEHTHRLLVHVPPERAKDKWEGITLSFPGTLRHTRPEWFANISWTCNPSAAWGQDSPSPFPLTRDVRASTAERSCGIRPSSQTQGQQTSRCLQSLPQNSWSALSSCS